MTAARALAIVIAIGASAVGISRGTWAAGGSDSSCYALMAQALASGGMQPRTVLAAEAPWPNRSATFAPGGFIPSPVSETAASPVCAPGFGMLLAPLYAVGGRDAIFLLTPLAGAVLVYLTFAFGRRMGGDAVGLAAAVATAAMPVFVFQVVQPMNDVAVAALWMAIIVTAARPRVRPALLGALTGLALFVRPNLAPAAAVVALWCGAGGWRRLVPFTMAAVPFALSLLIVNATLYGHPLESGYGHVDELFAVANVGTNLKNYGSALLATELGFPLLGLVAVMVAPPEQRRVTAMVTGVVVTMTLVYVLYRPLPEWWYLRFLLPALPALMVLALTTLARLTRGHRVVLAAALVLSAYSTTTPAMRDAWDLWRLESRFRTAGAIARERYPETAIFLTVWESGTVRYHAQRQVLVWDALAGESLDTALAWLTARGLEPYVLIEDWEEPSFRQRFAAHSAIGQLDWPPRFEIERRVRIYHPSDRATFLSGERVATEFVLPARR